MTEEGSFCAYCGTRIEPDSRYCSNCGRPTSLAGAQPASSAAAAASGTSSGIVRKKTHKKAIVGIVAITLIFAIVVVYATTVSNSSNPSRSALDDPQLLIQEVGAYMSQQGWQHPQQIDDTNMTRVAAGIVKSKYFGDSAVVVIVPWEKEDCWSGSVMGSDFVSTTHEGCNTGYFTIPCSGFSGSYSLAMQRSDESSGGEFLVQVWKGGKLLNQASTQASYGVVSFAGGCSGG